MTSVVTVLGVVVCVIIMLLFVILLDRKLLGSIQGREGPIILGAYGLFQSPIDGMKIFFKTIIFNRFTNKFVFFVCPLVAFFLGTLYWSFLPTSPLGGALDLTYDLLVVYTLMSLGVIAFIIAAWSAFSSKFPILGAIRELVQMLAYELLTGFVFLTLMLFSGGMSFRNLIAAQAGGVWFAFLITPFAIVFLIVILAELHRTPFDLSEAEAELTAGYQSEHGGSAFSAFYLAEYNNVLVFALIFVASFLGGWARPFPLIGDAASGFSAKICLTVFFCVAVRGALPRTRLTAFLNTAWGSLLPSSTNVFLIYLWLSFIFKISYPSEYLNGSDRRIVYYFTGALIFATVDRCRGLLHHKPRQPISINYARASMQKFMTRPGSDGVRAVWSEDYGVRAVNTGHMYKSTVWPVSNLYYPGDANDMFWEKKRILNNRAASYTRTGYDVNYLIRPDISILHPNRRHPSLSFPATVPESVSAVNSEWLLTFQNPDMESIFNEANRDMLRSAELSSPETAAMLADNFYIADYFGLFDDSGFTNELYEMGEGQEVFEAYDLLANYLSDLYEESLIDPQYNEFLEQFHWELPSPSDAEEYRSRYEAEIESHREEEDEVDDDNACKDGVCSL